MLTLDSFYDIINMDFYITYNRIGPNKSIISLCFNYVNNLLFKSYAEHFWHTAKERIFSLNSKKVRGVSMFVDAQIAENSAEREKINSILEFIAVKNKKWYWIYKRVASVLFSVVGIIIFAIPMLIITLLVWLDDRNVSPIYCQTRIGRHGKPFTLYKFRTMVHNAHEMKVDYDKYNEMDGPVFKIKDDPRVTKIGKFLRKTSLDELPQFFNVIKGDMVVIGPRPPLPEEVEQYTEYQKLRLIVTPGITCLWQVQPKRNELPFEEWVNLDIHYIMHRSFLMDIKIILRTIWVMFREEGR